MTKPNDAVRMLREALKKAWKELDNLDSQNSPWDQYVDLLAICRAALDATANIQDAPAQPADMQGADSREWWIAEMEAMVVTPIGSAITADMKRAANIAIKVANGEIYDDLSGEWQPAPNNPLSHEVKNHCWEAYKKGQISADHTAKQVFEEVLQNLANWLCLQPAQPAQGNKVPIYAPGIRGPLKQVEECMELCEPEDLQEFYKVRDFVNAALHADSLRLQSPVSDAQGIPSELFTIGNLIATQDNRCTDQPMFLVQQKRRVYGFDPEYGENVVWLHADGDYTEADDEEHKKFQADYEENLTEPEGWVRTSYKDEWEFVTACFTEQGCKDHITSNGHNLKEPRIYADGSYRNFEFREIRNWLLSIAAQAAHQEVKS